MLSLFLGATNSEPSTEPRLNHRCGTWCSPLRSTQPCALTPNRGSYQHQHLSNSYKQLQQAFSWHTLISGFAAGSQGLRPLNTVVPKHHYITLSLMRKLVSQSLLWTPCGCCCSAVLTEGYLKGLDIAFCSWCRTGLLKILTSFNPPQKEYPQRQILRSGPVLSAAAESSHWRMSCT